MNTANPEVTIKIENEKPDGSGGPDEDEKAPTTEVQVTADLSGTGVLVESETPPPTPLPSPNPAAATSGAADQNLAPASAGAADSTPEARAAAALASEYRGLAGVVPELIGGGTIDEVKASVDRARAAYQGARSSVLAELGSAVPAARTGSEIVSMPETPTGKIALGIAQAEAGRK